MRPKQHSLIYSVLFIALALAVLSYGFHPDTGLMQLKINGQPVDNPLIRLAALPSALIVMLLIGGLSVLLFMGMGLFIFFIALLFAMLGVFMIAPFFRPMPVSILLLVLLSASGSHKNG
ncbi:MAG: hypothetical protein CTY18_02205 [Methylomonas sp.]|nr:MAG: hypothetical protein CTY18_02205 [Methylomonas sp.]